MTFKRQALGRFGEDLALDYLQDKGYKLIGQNIKLFCGEIDLLMSDKAVLVIIEVKTKSGAGFGLPQEMIDYKKKHKLIQLAKALSQKYPCRLIRIDVIAIDKDNKIEHIINAIEEN